MVRLARALTLEAMYPMRYGNCKEIKPGVVWSVSAVLGHTGLPNGFSPWHGGPVPENVSPSIDLTPRREPFSGPRHIAPRQRLLIVNELCRMSGSTVRLHLHSNDEEATSFFNHLADIFTDAGMHVDRVRIDSGIPFSHGMALCRPGSSELAESVRSAFGAGAITLLVIIDRSLRPEDFYLFVGTKLDPPKDT